MNYNNLSGNTKTIKMVQNFATGNLETKGDIATVIVIDSVQNGDSARLVQNIVGGIKASGGVSNVVGVPNYGF